MGTTLCRPSSLTVLPLPIITRICPSSNRNLPFIFDRHAAMYLHGTFVGVFIVQSTCCVRMRHIHTQGILSITHTETVAWFVAGLTHEYTTCNCTPQSTAMLLQLSHLMLVAGCKLTRTLATAKWHFTATDFQTHVVHSLLDTTASADGWTDLCCMADTIASFSFNFVTFPEAFTGSSLY